jgi:hypothetical protein
MVVAAVHNVVAGAAIDDLFRELPRPLIFRSREAAVEQQAASYPHQGCDAADSRRTNSPETLSESTHTSVSHIHVKANMFQKNVPGV